MKVYTVCIDQYYRGRESPGQPREYEAHSPEDAVYAALRFNGQGGQQGTVSTGHTVWKWCRGLVLEEQ